MKRTLSLIMASTLLVAIGSAQEKGRAHRFVRQEVPPVLKKAIEEAPKLRYAGTRVVEMRREGQMHRHREIVTRDGKNLRVAFPEGSPFAGQVIVENSEERRHFFPDKNEIRVMPPRREEAFERLMRLAKMTDKIDLVQADGETVAGLGTTQVIVKDKSGNVLQRLFIDPRSGLLLKRLMFDSVGAQVGLYEFEKVDLSPRITPGLFKLHRRGAKVIRPIDTLREEAAKGGFPMQFLPAATGFTLTFSRVQRIENNDVLVQFYSSPNGRVSLFQVKGDVSREQLAKYARGDVKVYSWKSRGNTFVLVGNQDQATLQRLSKQLVAGT